MSAETRTRTTRSPRLLRDPLTNPVEAGRLTGTYTLVAVSILMLIGSAAFGVYYDREVIAPVAFYGLAGVTAALWLGANYIKEAIQDPMRRNRFKGFQTCMLISGATLVVLGFISMAYTNATEGLKVNGIESSIVCVAMFALASFVQAWRTKASLSRWETPGEGG